MSRRAAALRRAQGGYGAPVDRPRQRRSTADTGSRAVVRAHLFGTEVRDAPDPGDGTVGFRTYASVTETAYDMWDMFGPYTEEIAADAFATTLAAEPDVAFLLNHGGMTLARTTSGTLTLGADETGLWYEPRLDPANGTVRDVMSGVRRGDLSESSFAFRIMRGTWSPDYTAYRIEQVDLNRGDVSIVNYGANPATADYAPGSFSVDVDVDALDEDQALALTAALERRGVRTAPPRPGGMTRDELASLEALAAPHPLTAHVQP